MLWHRDGLLLMNFRINLGACLEQYRKLCWIYGAQIDKNSKLTNRRLGKLVDLFVLEVSASTASSSLHINRHSAERVYQLIRLCLARECECWSPFEGEVEVDESYFGGYRERESRKKRNHINGIENFWSFAKTKLKRYYGIDRNHFYLYLKEMEFRFNYRNHPNLGLLIRKIVSKSNRVLD